MANSPEDRERPWTYVHTVDRPFLTVDECKTVRELVHARREHWISRSPEGPFFTLGASAYLDGGPPPAGLQYHLKAERLNRVLREGLPWLYDRLADRLSAEIGEPAGYSHRLALPGFHIFLRHPAFELSLFSIHVDLPYVKIRWPAADPIDTTKPLSFTCAISIPRSGSGLKIWDIHHEEFTPASKQDKQRLVDTREQSLHRYQPGHMVLHSGHLVHQIAPFNTDDPADERITLQGHAIRTRSGWKLYF
jgi:hypothetical protein